MTWYYEHALGEFEESHIGDNVGFVYCITNNTTGQKYIGKKLFTKSKTRQVKGKKKKSIVESDWKVYYGSNKNLISDIAESGKDSVKRSIMRLCKNKTTTNYFELKAQIEEDVLLDNVYYNEFIGTRISGKFIYE